jgi:hypothetical protein
MDIYCYIEVTPPDSRFPQGIAFIIEEQRFPPVGHFWMTDNGRWHWPWSPAEGEKSLLDALMAFGKTRTAEEGSWSVVTDRILSAMVVTAENLLESRKRL